MKKAKNDIFTNMFMNAINWEKVKENEEILNKIFSEKNNEEEKNNDNFRKN